MTMISNRLPVRSLFFILSVSIYFFTNQLAAQNLLPNPGFETCHKLGKRWMASKLTFTKSIHFWTSPNDGSPDILFDRTLHKMFPIRPNVNLSNYRPHTGHIMIGLKTYGCAYNKQHCKEYIQVRTLRPLIPGHRYRFTAWVQNLHNSIKTANLGVVCSRDSVGRQGTENLFDLPAIPCRIEAPYWDTLAWQVITTDVIVTDTTHFLLFGNFSPDEQTLLLGATPMPVPYTYLLIDDLSLIDISSPPILSFALPDISFAFDEDELLPEGIQKLQDIIQNLPKDSATYNLSIIGHTDNKGSDAYNQFLSERRATTVANYLREDGFLNITQIEGLGATQPLVPNDSPEHRQQNRRVEILVIPKGGINNTLTKPKVRL